VLQSRRGRPPYRRALGGRFGSGLIAGRARLAAIVGLIVLGQHLGLTDWLAIAAIVTANARPKRDLPRPGDTIS